jgi:hypothetical protein
MKNRKIIYAILIIGSMFCLYVATALSVDNNITDEDIIAIESLTVDTQCKKSKGKLESEIKCLQSIQISVHSIGETRCAISSDVIEPAEIIKRNYGCCFDRARFIEKTARYYGYETRHLFLIQPKYNISVSNMLPLGQSSHATSEILTSQGWLGVDSNEPFILLDGQNNPSTYRNAIDNITRFPSMQPKIFYSNNIDIIYGLYSRHGNFHGLNLPGPEYVFSELLWNWN